MTSLQQKLSQIDQVNLIQLIENWMKEDSSRKFFVRPCTDNKMDDEKAPDFAEDDDDDDDDDDYTPLHKISPEDIASKKNNFLYVHQEKWQQDLLVRCGNICLIDATYKTTKYNLPLFFVCVLTNTGYQIVGELTKNIVII